MLQAASVTTLERFSQGFTFVGLREKSTINQDSLEANYQSVPADR
jgi:hypothetical protein